MDRSIDDIISSLEDPTYKTEAVQYLKDRRQHIEEEVLKLEQEGKQIRYRIGKSKALVELKMRKPGITEDPEDTHNLYNLLSSTSEQIVKFRPELYAINGLIELYQK